MNFTAVLFAVVAGSAALTGAAFGSDLTSQYPWPLDLLPPASRHATQIDGLSMMTLSWGHLMRGWALYPDGSGQFRSGRQVDGSREFVIVTRHLDAVAGRYEKVEALLRFAEPYAGSPPIWSPWHPDVRRLACPDGPSATDGPGAKYGGDEAVTRGWFSSITAVCPTRPGRRSSRSMPSTPWLKRGQLMLRSWTNSASLD